MIHYTLLPEKEIKKLKTEYRTRLLIILLFFISFAVLIGIGALTPAYLFSSIKEKDALGDLQMIKNNRQKNGTADISKDLAKTNDLVKKIKEHQDKVISSEVITRIILNKNSQIKMTSFQFSSIASTAKNATTSTTQIVIQGKSDDRESLVAFKESLEADSFFTKVELPVSDLAKSKDIPFSLRLSIISPLK